MTATQQLEQVPLCSLETLLATEKYYHDLVDNITRELRLHLSESGLSASTRTVIEIAALDLDRARRGYYELCKRMRDAKE